jgi:chromosome segregation ATPase
MSDDQPTLLVLHKIHQEIQQTNSRLGSLEGEVRQTSSRLGSLEGEVRQSNSRLESLQDHVQKLEDQVHEDLDSMARRQTQSEMRLATELVGVAKAVGDVKTLLKARGHQRFDDLERRVKFLEVKVR